MSEEEWLTSTDPAPMLEFLRGKVSDRKLRLFACACCRRIERLFTFESGRRASGIAERYADGMTSEDERNAAFISAARQATRWVNNNSLVDNAIGYTTGAAAYVLAKEEAIEAEANAAGAHEIVATAQACHHEVKWHGPAMIVALDTAFAVGAAVIAYLTAHEHEEETHRDEEVQTLAAGAEYAKAMGFNKGGYDYMAAAESARLAEGRIQCDLVRCIFGNPFHPATLEASLLTANVIQIAEGIYDERAFERMPILGDALEECGISSSAALSHCREPGSHVKGCDLLDAILGKI